MPVDGPKMDFATVTQTGTEPKIHSIFDFTAESLEQLAFWLEQRGIHIPISQILGFSQFVLKYATVDAGEATTSTTFTDLATVGPSLTGLSNGTYAVLFGCWGQSTDATQPARMSISVNGVAAAAGDGIQIPSSAAQMSSMRLIQETLSSGGNNSIAAKYCVAGGVNTATFAHRWIAALRVAN
jgi:hypothetical protein